MVSVGKTYQILFFAYIIIISFFTSGETTWNIGNLTVPVNYFLLVLLSVIAVPLLFYKRNRKVANMCCFLFSILTIFALCSGLIASDSREYSQFIIYTTFLSWILMFFSFTFSKIVSRGFVDGENLLTKLSQLLTITFVIYALFFSFEGGRYIERLQGPLGVASVIHVPMLLALSVHVSNVLEKRKYKTSILYAVLTLSTLLLANSRAGFASLIVFLILVYMQRGHNKKKLVLAMVMFLSVIVSINFVSFDRYSNFEDILREETIRTGIEIATDSLPNFLIGSGFGNIWPLNPVSGYIYTDHGMLLHHSHSVFLEIFVELGLFGILVFFLILAIILREFMKSRKHNNFFKACLLSGIISTIFPSFFTDMYLFRNWEITLIWWFYLFVALSLDNKPRTE